MECNVKDRQLIERLSVGDHVAFKELYLRYYGKAYFFLKGFVKDENDTKDLTQEIFVAIWDKRESLKGIQNLDAYLFVLSKNKALNYIEKKAVYSQHIENNITNHDSELPFTPQEDLEYNDLHRQINKLVESFSPQKKKVFVLSRKLGLSNDEIALRLSLSKKTIENHLNSALKDIRKQITEINQV